MNPRVAVITSGYLPVPNVLGGAVEALDMMMVQENEKTPNFDFTVFSSWAPGVDQIVGEGNFKHTDFCFIKTPLLVRAADRCISRCLGGLPNLRYDAGGTIIAQRLR